MSKLIGVATASLNEHYQATLFSGVLDAARERGYSVVALLGDRVPEAGRPQSNFLFDACSHIDLAGVVAFTAAIMASTQTPADQEFRARFRHLPFVSIGYPLPDAPTIMVENRASMSTLVRHLLTEHRCRNLLFVGGPKDHLDSKTREESFLACVREAAASGMELRYELAHGNFDEESGFRILRDYVRERPFEPFDAIVAANDNMALGARKAISLSHSPGWKACALTGFDDVPLAALEGPELTTVRQPLREMGRIALSSLLEMVETGRAIPPVQVPSTPIFRSSCGCPPGRAGESVSTQGSIEEFRLQWAQNEYYSSTIANIGSKLFGAESLYEVMRILESLSSRLPVALFHFALFESWPRPSGPHAPRLRLLYAHEGENRLYWGDEGLPASLQGIVDRAAKVERGELSQLLLSLNYGDEQLGVIQVLAEEALFPHIANLVGHLVVALKRIKGAEEQKDRARQLGAEVEHRTRDLVAINKRLRAEIARRVEARRDFDALLEALPIPLVVTSEDGEQVLYDNRALQGIVNDCESLEDLAMVFDPPLLPRAIAREAVNREFRLYAADGQIRSFLLQRAAFRFREREALVLGFLDITAQKNLERDILRVSEYERQRVGQDFHDDICQRLAGLSLLFNAFAHSLSSGPLPSGVRERCDEIQATLNDALQRTRNYARGLYPVELEDTGLLASLGELCARMTRETGQRFLFITNVDAETDLGLSREVEVHLYRLVQEALHNVVKHAKATESVVSLEKWGADGAESLDLRISDNGLGMVQSKGGLGIRSMRYRASEIGASIAFEPRAGGGTEVRLLLRYPLQGAAQ
jgi:signal transduction histidine kinase/DNA-binding LacI/PurR family transcriptional regulator